MTVTSKLFILIRAAWILFLIPVCVVALLLIGTLNYWKDELLPDILDGIVVEWNDAVFNVKRIFE